jgi:cytochrome P450
LEEQTATVLVTDWDEARDVYRHRDLRQAHYDAGEVVMSDVLVNLHGDEHRRRRRLENRLFVRDVFLEFQKERFPPIVARTLRPYAAAGAAELVDLGHELMMNLSADIAGVDRPLQTAEESRSLYQYLMVFIEGATLAHYTGDREEKSAEVRQALNRFDQEFLQPSIQRRTEEVGAATRDARVHQDVLSILLEHRESLSLTHDAILREIAFFLLAGAHTSATAFVRTLHHIFKWIERNPIDRERLISDPTFVQRCVHETIRLWPSSPIGERWALEAITLRSTGRTIPKGAKVVIDLMEINRSPSIFGRDAADFNPYREIGQGAAPWGQSFGGGAHLCIGQDLAAGVLHNGGPDEAHLTGLIPVAISAMMAIGVRPDPSDPATVDSSTARPYWGRYPVRLG